jgi:deoxycytidylate deaminase
VRVLKTIRVFYELNKYSIHAENEAIRKIKNKSILKECKIYIGKINDGEITQAYPCDMCNKLLKKYGVKKICNLECI